MYVHKHKIRINYFSLLVVFVCTPPPIVHFTVSNDDYLSISTTLGTFTNQQPSLCFNVPIIDNVVTEPTEYFTARLMLNEDSVTTIAAQRIMVDSQGTRVQIMDSNLSKCNTVITKYQNHTSILQKFIVLHKPGS